MRFAKFLVVGAGNTVLTLALFNVFAVALHWPAWLGNAIAYAVGIANSYVWNRRWTFGDREGLHPAGSAVRFVLVNLGGLGITTALVAVLDPVATRAFAGTISRGWTLNAVELVAVCVGLVWNFTLANAWAFAERRKEDGVS